MSATAAGQGCSLNSHDPPCAVVLVEFERDDYAVLENAGSVQVCVDVTQPTSQASLPLSFSVTATVVAESEFLMTSHCYIANWLLVVSIFKDCIVISQL